MVISVCDKRVRVEGKGMMFWRLRRDTIDRSPGRGRGREKVMARLRVQGGGALGRYIIVRQGFTEITGYQLRY